MPKSEINDTPEKVPEKPVEKKPEAKPEDPLTTDDLNSVCGGGISAMEGCGCNRRMN